MPDSYPVVFRRRKREDAEDFGKEIEGRAKGCGKDELGEGGFFSPSLRLPHNPLRAPKSDWVRVWCYACINNLLFSITLLSCRPGQWQINKAYNLCFRFRVCASGWFVRMENNKCTPSTND